MSLPDCGVKVMVMAEPRRHSALPARSLPWIQIVPTFSCTEASSKISCTERVAGGECDSVCQREGVFRSVKVGGRVKRWASSLPATMSNEHLARRRDVDGVEGWDAPREAALGDQHPVGAGRGQG